MHQAETGPAADTERGTPRESGAAGRIGRAEPDPALAALVQAALPHVVFDGWGPAALRAAAADLGMGESELRRLCPRGALDLAIAHHRMGDRQLAREMAAGLPEAMRMRERIAWAVRRRLELEPDREVVRRASALFALPQHAAEGAALMWETADTIWSGLGDSSDDVNWYTKRLTLAGVHAATVLYWLGDASEGGADTWAFLDRRIEDVMRIEKVKARVRASPLGALGGLAERLFGPVRAPGRPPADLPGQTVGDTGTPPGGTAG